MLGLSQIYLGNMLVSYIVKEALHATLLCTNYVIVQIHSCTEIECGARQFRGAFHETCHH